MIKNLFTFATILFFSTILNSQNVCSKYYPFKEGVKFEMTTYNKNDKITGKIKYEVKNVKDNSIVLANEIFDDKGESVLSSELNLICSDNGISIDFKSLVSSQVLDKYKEMNMDIELSGTNIDIPNDLSPGQSLPDAELLLTLSMASVNMKMTTKMTNRKVIAKESVKTSAGTFDCVVLTNDTEVNMGIKTTMSSKEWLSEGVGLVKSEQYDKKGKLLSKSILTKFEN